MEQQIKAGDIVRLTDPINNGEVVRIESVDEHGFASWLGGAQKGDMEQIDLIDVNSDLIYYYHSLSELVRHIEEKTGIKLYPESAVVYWKHRAEIAEQDNALNEKLLKDEHNKLLNVQDELHAKEAELNKSRTATKDWFDLFKKAETENKKLRERIKQLKADLEEGGFNDERNFI